MSNFPLLRKKPPSYGVKYLPWSICDYFSNWQHVQELVEVEEIDPPQFRYFFEAILGNEASAAEKAKSAIVLNFKYYEKDYTILVMVIGGAVVVVFYAPAIVMGTAAACMKAAAFYNAHKAIINSILWLIAQTIATSPTPSWKQIANNVEEKIKEIDESITAWGQRVFYGLADCSFWTQMWLVYEIIEVKAWKDANIHYPRAWNFYKNFISQGKEEEWVETGGWIWTGRPLFPWHEEVVTAREAYEMALGKVADAFWYLRRFFPSPEGFGDFDPEREETYIIEDGHYPIAGDKWLDKQRREEES
jgi:hypothetical protein